MSDTYNYQGASGANYTFVLTDVRFSRTLPMDGGLIAFANADMNPLSLVEANSIHDFFAGTQAWTVAQWNGATHAYIHSSPNESTRKAALQDLIANYLP